MRDSRTAHLSPLAALTLEPGDRVAFAGLAATWRLTGVDHDEHPRATLLAAEAAEAGDVGLPVWTPPAPVEPAGPPLLFLLDLPPLPGAEDDIRPLVAAGLEPWRDLDVHAGVDADALTIRTQLTQPAGVGETLTDLPAGPLHRLDTLGRLTVRIEGATLQSRSMAAVLAGANALAVRGESSEWEVLQFLTAEAIDAETWTLSGLLRGQCGSDPAMADPTPAGAPVVVLGDGLARGQVALSERGLPLLWRAAPAGGPPGGNAMSEASLTWRGLSLRPWSPVHLAVTAADGGDLVFSWVRRARLGGDGWDDEPPLCEEREVYRIEILDGETVVRTAETDTPSFTWTAALQAADFPGGVPDPLTIGVAQGSATFGWGAASRRSLWR